MTMTVTYDYDSFRSDLRKKMHRLGTGRATKSDEFEEKFQRGGGGFIFNPKINDTDFGNFKQGFLSIKCIQKSNFRAQGRTLSYVDRRFKVSVRLIG